MASIPKAKAMAACCYICSPDRYRGLRALRDLLACNEMELLELELRPRTRTTVEPGCNKGTSDLRKQKQTKCLPNALQFPRCGYCRTAVALWFVRHHWPWFSVVRHRPVLRSALPRLPPSEPVFLFYASCEPPMGRGECGPRAGDYGSPADQHF